MHFPVSRHLSIQSMSYNHRYLNSFVLYTGCSKNHKEAFMSGDLEPWIFRGGLTGEFQVCQVFADACALSVYHFFFFIIFLFYFKIIVIILTFCFLGLFDVHRTNDWYRDNFIETLFIIFILRS